MLKQLATQVFYNHLQQNPVVAAELDDDSLKQQHPAAIARVLSGIAAIRSDKLRGAKYERVKTAAQLAKSLSAPSTQGIGRIVVYVHIYGSRLVPGGLVEFGSGLGASKLGSLLPKSVEELYLVGCQGNKFGKELKRLRPGLRIFVSDTVVHERIEIRSRLNPDGTTKDKSLTIIAAPKLREVR